MKIINFGGVIKKLRIIEGITQSELVELVDIASCGTSGVDSVSISRWENNIIAPCHRRQVDLIKCLGYTLEQLVEPSLVLIEQSELRQYLKDKLIVNHYWDFTSNHCDSKDLIKKKITIGKATNYLFLEKETQIPVAHLMLHFERNTLTEGERYLVVDSIYCNSSCLLLELVGFVMSCLMKDHIDGIIYKSKNNRAPLNRFIKSIGFRTVGKVAGQYISILTYSDIMYNKMHFGLIFCYINTIDIEL